MQLSPFKKTLEDIFNENIFNKQGILYKASRKFKDFGESTPKFKL